MTPIREFGPSNKAMLAMAVLLMLLNTWTVYARPDQWRFDATQLGVPIAIAAQAIEPAFPKDHRVARGLRAAGWLALGVAVIGLARQLFL